MIVALVVLVPLAGLAVYRWWPRRHRPSDSLAVEREATLRQIASLQRGRDLADRVLAATDVTEGEPGISNDPSARVTPWAVTSPSVATPLTDARPVGDSTAGRPLPARSAKLNQPFEEFYAELLQNPKYAKETTTFKSVVAAYARGDDVQDICDDFGVSQTEFAVIIRMSGVRRGMDNYTLCLTCGDKGWISAPGEACSFLERVVPCPFCDGPGPREAA